MLTLRRHEYYSGWYAIICTFIFLIEKLDDTSIHINMSTHWHHDIKTSCIFLFGKWLTILSCIYCLQTNIPNSVYFVLYVGVSCVEIFNNMSVFIDHWEKTYIKIYYFHIQISVYRHIYMQKIQTLEQKSKLVKQKINPKYQNLEIP